LGALFALTLALAPLEAAGFGDLALVTDLAGDLEEAFNDLLG